MLHSRLVEPESGSREGFVINKKNVLHPILLLMVTTAALVAAPVAAKNPATQPELIQNLVRTAGGEAAASMDGVFKLEVNTEETTLDGKSHKLSFTAWVNPSSWAQRRIQLNSKVVIGFDGKNGWATIDGKEDQRPQTPLQAQGTIDRFLFPVLLPFSLQTKNIAFGKPKPATWQDKKALKLPATFPPNFFYSPVMDTPWMIALDQKKERVLGAEFLPPSQYVEVGAEGIRYYILTRKTIEGVTLPSKILAVAIDENGLESGHVKVYDIKITKVKGDASLFLSPAALKAIGEETS